MPTGYTAAIEKGISFEHFVLSCARNFGACIALRDENSDVLPTIENVTFGRDEYSKEELEQEESNLIYYKNLSDEDWKNEQQQSIQNEQNWINEQIKKKTELLEKYHLMRQKVYEWNPPTPEHYGLRDFMLSQIDDSIKHDCDLSYYKGKLEILKTETVEEYKEKTIADCERSIEYFKKEIRENNKRNKNRVEWVQQLLDSLKKD